MLNDKRVYISYSQNHLFDFWGVNERWKTWVTIHIIMMFSYQWTIGRHILRYRLEETFYRNIRPTLSSLMLRRAVFYLRILQILNLTVYIAIH